MRFGLCAAIVVALSVHAKANDRYTVIFRNGDAVTAREFKDWTDVRRQPHINGRKLFDPNNHARIIVDNTLQSKLAGPYIEFANGDVLPGRVVSASLASAAKGLPKHFAVALRSPLAGWNKGSAEIAVRQDRVSRVVFVEESATRELQPGLVALRSGRMFKASRIRWSAAGIKALTKEGIVSATYADMAEVHLPGVNVIDAVTADLTAPSLDSSAAIGRLQTTNGAVLTYQRSLVQMSGNDHGFQPAWSFHTIRIPQKRIVTRSYRTSDRIPLAMLPGRTLNQRSFTGYLWPWRLNTSVRGHRLVSGSVMSDTGIGSHSHCEIAFDIPPFARSLSSWVGIDRAVGAGGCAKCVIYQDRVGGKKLWESGFLRGGEEPKRFEIGLQNIKRIVLVTEYGHEGRPAGADPLDIRDEVDWIEPMIAVDRSKLISESLQITDVYPQLDGWQISDELKKRATFKRWWHSAEGRWINTLHVDSAKGRIDQAKPYEFTRRVKVTLNNGRIVIACSRDTWVGHGGHAFHTVILSADGKKLESTMNGDVQTSVAPGYRVERVWMLGELVDKEVVLNMRVEPKGNAADKPSGLILQSLDLTPLITDLPADGQPIKPQTPITSLKAVKYSFKHESTPVFEPGKLTDGNALLVNRYRFNEGIGAPYFKNEITYDLDPSWRRFVAVIGLAGGDYFAGPYRILLDGKVHWEDPATFDRNSAGRQIDVGIPQGHKTITLQLSERNRGFAAWADGGFVKD